jgi:hypothetical protein
MAPSSASSAAGNTPSARCSPSPKTTRASHQPGCHWPTSTPHSSAPTSTTSRHNAVSQSRPATADSLRCTPCFASPPCATPNTPRSSSECSPSRPTRSPAAHLLPHHTGDRCPARRTRPQHSHRTARSSATARGRPNRATSLRAHRPASSTCRAWNWRLPHLHRQGPKTACHTAHCPNRQGAPHLDERMPRPAE